MMILNSSVYNLATPQDMTSSSSRDQVEQNTITYNAAISACNWFCIRFPWSCWIPPKILQIRWGLPDFCFMQFLLGTITVILILLYIFSRDTFLTLPMAHVTHYWRYQATVRPPRHSGERGSQWPAALELLFSEMPRVSVERNIITFSAAISVFPDKMLGGVGDWRGYMSCCTPKAPKFKQWLLVERKLEEG